MADPGDKRPVLVVVTGLSGAGLTTVLNTLQDSGFYCIDNLPVQLVQSAVDFILKGKVQARGFALGMDIRDKRFAQDFPALKQQLSAQLRLDVIFLTAESEVLASRYNATRRAHPLVGKRGDISSAIEKERALLAPVKTAADQVVDTTTLSPHALARRIEDRYANAIAPRSLYVTITSFGYKYGQLRPSDEILDVRFLPNPFFIQDLREKSGKEREVAAYIAADQRTQSFLEKIEDLHRFLLPLYFSEGKHYFRIGIGCTGGKHRSVFVAEWLAERLRAMPLSNIVVNVIHRDLEEGEPDTASEKP